MPKRIDGSVVVLTGASSGIARGAAVALVERGAKVVVAARDAGSLDDVVRACDSVGGPGAAYAVPTDVTDESAMHALAAAAVERFGRVDVWVNGAAVMLYGGFLETPSEAYRRVIETNLFGQIHGARAVLPWFAEQRSGTLVNIGSVWGSVTSPYVGPYVVSKFGVRAFSETLQEGLRLDKATRRIRVCTILPQSVDTPIFEHAGNYTGRRAKPVPPVIDPQRAVRAIVRTIEHPRRQRTVGGFGRALEVGHAVLPGLMARASPMAMRLAAFSRKKAPAGPGNLFEPIPELNGEYADWRVSRAKVVAGTVVAVAVLGPEWLRRRRH